MGTDFRVKATFQDPNNPTPIVEAVMVYTHAGVSPHWSYSGFHRFRASLAELCGIELDKMGGFGGSRAWPSVESEPLVPLLNHSDCDGELSAEECRVVAPRLRELLPKLSNDYDRVHGERLAALMDLVVDHGADGATLVFC